MAETNGATYEPTPKDRKEMTDAELIAEYERIGFTYKGIIQNGEAPGLEVRVTRGKEQFLIPTAAINESVALQEALFSLTNIVVIQQHQEWLEHFSRNSQYLQEMTEPTTQEHPNLAAFYIWTFSITDYIRRLFS